ncbi:hypothetical protein PACTADRAFT_80367 [Pachysolen tannophilus NRRL Y-2460]|uniref:Lysophospholipase n=1 Tax=Pachysolen tannophilus NRRL Y-2460 TaxID=669874 RepID=A0A1E4TX49_PACTA|nr:hypothetical protein PACTADRAFT_80367 [Pachysolen tannophilus NRRL Y-2460]
MSPSRNLTRLILLLLTCFVFVSLAGWGNLIRPVIGKAGGNFNDQKSQKALPLKGQEVVRDESYAPFLVKCPREKKFVREATDLCDGESNYIKKRTEKTQSSFENYLKRFEIPGLNSTDFLQKSIKPVIIGLAISGGGYRSMLTSGGFISALDDRTINSTESGHLGGLLQSSSYIAGVSGGSWLVTSLALYDYLPVTKIRDKSLWKTNEPLLEGIPNFDVSRTAVPISEDDKKKKNLQQLNHDKEIKELAKRGISQLKSWYEIKKTDEFEIENEQNELNSDSENFKKINNGKAEDIGETQLSIIDLIKISLGNVKENNKNINETSTLVTPNKNKGGMKDILKYYSDIHLDVRPKRTEGFQISFTDYWGRAISKRIFPLFNKEKGITISDIRRIKSFKSFDQPFPLLVANSQSPNTEFTSLNSQIFEFSPFEFGSWDSFLKAFVDIKYLGSNFFNGDPINKAQNGKDYICVEGFDNAGFITGTSSSLFNNVLIYIWQVAASTKKETYNAIKKILTNFGLNIDKIDDTQKVVHSDYALFSPNPFYGFKRSENPKEDIYNSTNLFLADGGEDGQNIPFQPLLQNKRKLDIIFAIDSTSDYDNWPNGTSINFSFQRYWSQYSPYSYKTIIPPLKTSNNKKSFHKTVFPSVPFTKDIVEKNYNRRPIFFGCDLDKDYTSIEEVEETSLSRKEEKDLWLPPLIIYYSNSEQSYKSNTSTFKLTYNDNEVFKMIENGYNIATFKNSTLDTSFAQCVSCAILKREFDRRLRVYEEKNFEIPQFCQNCYKKYCWSNKTNT